MYCDVELHEAVDLAAKICIYNDGKSCVYNKGDLTFNSIVIEWKEMIDGAHEMPAFCVSLDSETRKEMQKGLWVEFVFDEPICSNEMPYEKLLIGVKRDYHGFNLIRYNQDVGYDGRCFYYDLLSKDMSKFYDFIINF